MALFLLLLARYVFILVRSSPDFSGIFVPNWQSSSSASNILSEIKLRSRSLIQSFSPSEKKTSCHRVNNSCHRINNSCHRINNPEPGGFLHSSPLYHRPLPRPPTASKRQSVVGCCHPPQGLPSTFWCVRAPAPRVSVIVWARGLSCSSIIICPVSLPWTF